METPQAHTDSAVITSAGCGLAYPRSFGKETLPDEYLDDPLVRLLVGFFQGKGLARLKDEDGREEWYGDWLAYQAKHGIYASLLVPRQFSKAGGELSLPRLVRFLEVFAYFSPSYGYSLQVTFLGFFSIMMGKKAELKREAAEVLEAGKLLAFGISEKDHGSDLLGNGFTVKEDGAGGFVAGGSKYYIGNANCASMISVLARKEDARSARHPQHTPVVLFALRPEQAKGFRNVKKIRTMGIRSAYVGEFEVREHELSAGDFVAEGRDAWDAVFGTVTLGKFCLGFGSIGICERALDEAVAHMTRRRLYRKSVLEMPHIRFAATQAYARLAAMKLYAYRALDYVHGANAGDRRYLLFCAVQKAKVSTEGVKVMAQLSECMGAKGFEAETYFESALRDIQLIPGLEGSTHINLHQAAEFMPRYFGEVDESMAGVPSVAAGQIPAGENSYLMEARTGGIAGIAFPDFLRAYEPLLQVRNVRLFCRQARGFKVLVCGQMERAGSSDTRLTLGVAQCMATIVYGQLIAENAVHLAVAPQMVSAIFHLLVANLSADVQALAALPGADFLTGHLARRLITIPKTAESDWDFVAGQFAAPPHAAEASAHA